MKTITLFSLNMFVYNEEDLFYSNHKEILFNINKDEENIVNEN